MEYRIGQVQYLVDGLEAIGIVCQQAGGHAAFVDAGDCFHTFLLVSSTHALACELAEKWQALEQFEIGSLLQAVTQQRASSIHALLSYYA